MTLSVFQIGKLREKRVVIMSLKIVLDIFVVLWQYEQIIEAVKTELQSYNVPDYYIQMAHRVHGGEEPMYDPQCVPDWEAERKKNCSSLECIFYSIYLSLVALHHVKHGICAGDCKGSH